MLEADFSLELLRGSFGVLLVDSSLEKFGSRYSVIDTEVTC